MYHMNFTLLKVSDEKCGLSNFVVIKSLKSFDKFTSTSPIFNWNYIPFLKVFFVIKFSIIYVISPVISSSKKY